MKFNNCDSLRAELITDSTGGSRLITVIRLEGVLKKREVSKSDNIVKLCVRVLFGF